MIYLDTSVLGALFVREPVASAILARLETVGQGDLCVGLELVGDGERWGD